MIDSRFCYYLSAAGRNHLENLGQAAAAAELGVHTEPVADVDRVGVRVVPDLKDWQETERIDQLKHDRAEYDREIDNRYPASLLEHQHKQAEFLKKDHEWQGLKYVGCGALVLIGILIFSEGFVAGALAVLTIVLTGSAFYYHEQNKPNFDESADPRTPDEKLEETGLRRREMDPDYDRDRWLGKHGDTFVEQVSSDIIPITEIRPITEDDGKQPAIILTLRKKRKSGTDDEKDGFDRDTLFWVKIERRKADGLIEIVEDRAYEGWPVSWSVESAEALAQNENCLAFKRDEIVDEV